MSNFRLIKAIYVHALIYDYKLSSYVFADEYYKIHLTSSLNGKPKPILGCLRPED